MDWNKYLLVLTINVKVSSLTETESIEAITLKATIA